jgi:hypothetical protein
VRVAGNSLVVTVKTERAGPEITFGCAFPSARTVASAQTIAPAHASVFCRLFMTK